MKVFISFPMKGKTYEELVSERQEILNEISHILKDVELVNSIIQDPTEHATLWYLGRAVQTMADVDIAVFAKGWEEARGCRIEYQCAKEYGIPTLEIH